MESFSSGDEVLLQANAVLDRAEIGGGIGDVGENRIDEAHGHFHIRREVAIGGGRIDVDIHQAGTRHRSAGEGEGPRAILIEDGRIGATGIDKLRPRDLDGRRLEAHGTRSGGVNELTISRSAAAPASVESNCSSSRR